MKSFFRNPIWLVVLFSIIGLIALFFIKDVTTAWGFSCLVSELVLVLLW